MLHARSALLSLALVLAAPIGLTRDAPDYGVILYVSFEHFFIRPPATIAPGK